MAAGAAEPLLLLRVLSRITLAPVAPWAKSALSESVLIFNRHHIQALPNIKGDCKENIMFVRDLETNRTETTIPSQANDPLNAVERPRSILVVTLRKSRRRFAHDSRLPGLILSFQSMRDDHVE